MSVTTPCAIARAGFLAFLLILSAHSELHAQYTVATLAADNAGNYSVWGNGAVTGFGSGFTANWTITPATNGSQNGTFLATNDANCQIQSSTRCWGLYAKSSQEANAIRTLSSPAPVGSTLTHEEVTFDAQGLASGVYVVRLEAGAQAATQRLTLLK